MRFSDISTRYYAFSSEIAPVFLLHRLADGGDCSARQRMTRGGRRDEGLQTSVRTEGVQEQAGGAAVGRSWGRAAQALAGAEFDASRLLANSGARRRAAELALHRTPGRSWRRTGRHSGEGAARQPAEGDKEMEGRPAEKDRGEAGGGSWRSGRRGSWRMGAADRWRKGLAEEDGESRGNFRREGIVAS